MNYNKWVACWGNATSISDRTISTYSKDITLRYPIRICFSGSKLRFRFSNFTGTEEIALKASVAKTTSGNGIDVSTITQITDNRNDIIKVQPGNETESDEIPFPVSAGETVTVSIYLPDFTQMNSGTLITGPLSKGWYSYGKHDNDESLPVDYTRNTNWFYFLNTIDIFTEEKNHALVCYGDSITAQSWPDYLSLRAWEENKHDIAIIRRAVSGTRILRQYDCITYQAYGIKGATRFPVEMNVSGCDGVIIQHGINDIIHPVGVETNQFRPWSDLPTADEMTAAIKTLYCDYAHANGIKVYGGTLLPIYGWRTYADFREELKNNVNDWIRNADCFDGVCDFDKAVRDENDNRKFKEGYDSGDHLHPSEKAYQAMAECAFDSVIK